MNEPSASIIASMIAVIGVLGTAVASIIAVVITSKKNEEISRLKVFQDLQIEYDKDLRKRRIDGYMDLWLGMIALAKYPEPEQLSFERIQQLALAFRGWYFQGGGLIASETTRDQYFDLQDALKIILQKWSKKWSPDDAALRDASRLSGYLDRAESRPAPAEVMAVANSDLPEGAYVPETVAAALRALGSKLRTSMTEDVLTRVDTALKREQHTPSDSKTV